MKSKGTRIEHMQANAIHSDSRANATDHSADAMFAAANAFETDVEFSAEDLKGSKYVARMNTLSSVKMIDQMLMERESNKEGRGIKRGKRANESERDRGVSGIGHIGDRRGQRGQRERAAREGSKAGQLLFARFACLELRHPRGVAVPRHRGGGCCGQVRT